MDNKLITKEQFIKVLSLLKVEERIDTDYLYDVFVSVFNGCNDLQDANLISSFYPINQISIINYCIGEYLYSFGVVPKDRIDEFLHDDQRKLAMIAVVADKYVTNEHLAYRMQSFDNKFNPPISTIYTYVNFMLSMLSRYKQNVPNETVIVDILKKSVLMEKCILDLLVNGFETEAFSTWRTLHETESILSILIKNGKPVIDRYLEHMTYAIAFRDGIQDKTKQDEIFAKLKGEMKDLGLKSKDMKRYIEYGWLTGIKDYEKIEGLKFNFRDGVENAAGLSSYHKWYEMSSEIAHSSPLLIYSRKRFFYYVTIINLYESFFRIEDIFTAVYLTKASEEEIVRYKKMREMYYSQLASIYQREKMQFALLNKDSKSN